MGSFTGRTVVYIAVTTKGAQDRATANSTMEKAKASAKAYGVEECFKEKASIKSHGGLLTGWFGTREKFKPFADPFRVIHILMDQN
jgi:hypothetical protein